MTHGDAFDVRFVDDRLAPRNVRWPIVAPIETIVDDHRLGHPAGRVVHITGKVLGSGAQPIRKDGRIPVHLAADRTGIRIDEQLVRVETIAFAWSVTTMHSVAV